MKTKWLLGSLLLIAVIACNEEENAYTASTDDGYTSTEVPSTYNYVEKAEANASPQKVQQKLIKTGQLTFQVEDLKQTHAFLVNQLETYKGYVSRDEEAQGYNRLNHYLEIRIPAEHFDTYLEAISNEVNHFDEKNIEVRDVTDQYVDLDARLNSKKELEKRYLSLLDKAKTMEDILNIEREINNLRTEIESMEGRMRLMKNQISYATLSINYYTTEAAQAQGFSSKLGNELHKGWDGLLSFLLGLVRIWPFLIIITGIGFIIKGRLKRRKVKA